jgi:glycosyltransferase involved in cell wall biosynthesis
MRIGIDARAINNDLDGIGRYGLCLLRGLAKIDDDNEYVVFKSCHYNGKIVNKTNFREKNVRVNRFDVRENFVLSSILHREKLDVFHSIHFTLPLFYGGRTVVTVHDTMALKMPWFFSGWGSLQGWFVKKYFGIIVPLTIRKADGVIAVSERTKKDILEDFDIPRERIEVINEAVEERFSLASSNEAFEAIKSKYGLPDKYILSVGNFKPYKNIPALVEAFSLLKERYKIEHKLVLAGRKGRYFKKVHELVDRLGIESEVMFTGVIDDVDMPALYSFARCFVFPSLYEGFGLPPLEAMACGTPTITSNVSSLPEVVGEAGIRVDPYNVDELAEAIYRVLSDEGLARELSEKGLERAKAFSWEKVAKDTLEVYKKLSRKGPSARSGEAQ